MMGLFGKLIQTADQSVCCGGGFKTFFSKRGLLPKVKVLALFSKDLTAPGDNSFIQRFVVDEVPLGLASGHP